MTLYLADSHTRYVESEICISIEGFTAYTPRLMHSPLENSLVGGYAIEYSLTVLKGCSAFERQS